MLRKHHVLPLSAGMAIALGIVALADAGHADEPVRELRARSSRASVRSHTEAELPVVRLNFISTPWEKVLQHLADETNSTLVAHDIPQGRFSRRDLRRHTRTEAVQILNQELEPLGYRILEKDDFLTVIEIQRARFEYPRAVVGATDAPPQGAPADVAGLSEPQDDAPLTERRLPPRESRAAGRSDEGSTRRGLRHPIQLAAHEPPAADPDANARHADARATDTGDDLDNTSDPPSTERRAVPTRHPALEIAQQLYSAFSDRAELIETPRSSLPAFRVYRQPITEDEAADEWFTIEMDSDRNELHVRAPRAIAESVDRLIRKLDETEPRPGEVVRLVPEAEQAAAVARELQTQFDALRRESTRAARGRNPFDVAQAQPGQPAEAPPAQQPPPDGQQPGLAPEVLGNLRGDVTVEALPDLDLLILSGNEQDIEAVMEVIRLIEQMAIGATPAIELFVLQNVDSESLAVLLNDVFTRLSTLSSGTAASARQTRAVNIVPVGRPNAILVLAPQSMLDYVLDLAEKLDQPVEVGTEVEVFFLKHAVATQVATMLEQFYDQRTGLQTQIRVVADARTNSVIVNASPMELAEVTRFVRQVDRQTSRSTAQVRVVPLKNALADELATFLNEVIQGVLNPPQAGAAQQLAAAAAAGTNQALRDTKSVVLEFLATDGVAQRVVRSGLLSDVRISGDVRTNSLTITAPEASMQLLLELVAVLDQPASAFADIKVFPLERADAASAAELLQSLFPEGQEGQPGVQLAGAEGYGSALVPLRVSVDARTNSIVAVGSPDVLQMVEAILFRIDAAEARNRRTEVIRLRNSPAADVALAINQFLQSQRELLQIDPTRISTSEILEQEVIVTPEPISNSLIISATPQYFDRIVQMTRELDREPPQVMIQALIVEVTLEDTDEFGVELGFQDSVLFDRSVIDPESLVTINETTTLPNGTQTTTQRIISQTGVPGFLFNNQPLGNNVGVNSSQVGTQGLTNFALGRVNDDLGFGGLVLSASSESVSVLLRALAAHRNVRILSRPQITALDNQLAQIQVGQQVPIVDGVTISATGLANPTIIQDQAGIILTVTPRISPEGQIVMEVIAEKSQFTGEGVPIFTDATTGNVITSPIKDVTTAITSAKVSDGQTIVLGGMITKTEDVIESKVPYLGDIPIIGNAFRYDSRQHRRTELIIFLTPRIVRGDADVELIKQVEMERLHFFEDEAEMIHGPLMGVPSAAIAPLNDPNNPQLFAEPPFVEPGAVFPDDEFPEFEPTPVGPRNSESKGPTLKQPPEPDAAAGHMQLE